AYSVDISADAIGVARKNAERNGVLNRLKFINADVFSDFPSFKVDGIVSNPPYIEDGDFTSLMTDVRDYEPKIALLGGKDGLDFYRLICKRGFKILNEGGFIAFEVGYNQAKEVKQILVENQFENIGFSMDLAGINRVVYAFKNK
ncbi:MAG: peptide chain release factor N(5)-glutamine methyltransferase, partial [Clostridia bacterium]|nr:peptide chain release factor N(5)-glutamine methyltransferase [Clostridia bacterium]